MQLTSFPQFLSYTSQMIQMGYQILAVPVTPAIVQNQYGHVLKKRITENLDTMIMQEIGVHKINPHTQYDN
jgi:hypothetical protein